MAFIRIDLKITKDKQLNVDVLITKLFKWRIDVDDGVIIPIAKIKSGFITGGSDKQKEKEEKSSPFGGATGGTVTITPIAFLSCINGSVKVLHLEEESHLIGKAVDGSLELINRLISKFSSKTEPTVYPVERE